MTHPVTANAVLSKRRWTRRYWVRLIGSLIVILLCLPFAFSFGLGVVQMTAMTHPGCYEAGGTPADWGFPNYLEVVIPRTGGGGLHGFYIPGILDATIIVPPPYAVGRGGMLSEASLMAARGYNILTFEAHLCRGGTVHSLGYQEVAEVGDALSYLEHNADGIQVNMARIGLHGFSSAGATSTMAAARYPQIRAVLSEGGYETMNAYYGIDGGSNLWDKLRRAGMAVAYWLSTRNDLSVLDPLAALPKIAPRQVYLVYGSQEETLNGAHQQLATIRLTAPNNVAHLWVIPGAGHGYYTMIVPRENYARHVIPFYDCALLDQCAAWQTLWKPF